MSREISDGLAEDLAAYLRAKAGNPEVSVESLNYWADLLDPPPKASSVLACYHPDGAHPDETCRCGRTFRDHLQAAPAVQAAMDDAALDAIEARAHEWDCECDYATRPDTCGIPEHAVTYCVDHLCESDPCPLDERGLPADVLALVAALRAEREEVARLRGIIRENADNSVSLSLHSKAIARAEAAEAAIAAVRALCEATDDPTSGWTDSRDFADATLRALDTGATT